MQLVTISRFSVVFLGPRTNAELVPKFQVALHASHAAHPMTKLKILPNAKKTLTLGWTTKIMGDMCEGAQHREEKSKTPRRTGRLTVGRNTT
jgi:hypothetical protein